VGPYIEESKERYTFHTYESGKDQAPQIDLILMRNEDQAPFRISILMRNRVVVLGKDAPSEHGTMTTPQPWECFDACKL
jgi:hypothetical protein